MSSVTTTVTPTVSLAWVAFTMSDVVVAALVAGLVSLVTVLAEHWRTRRDRLREQYAEAFRAYAAYREFPYVIRRRAGDDLSERARVSEDLRHIQESLTFWSTWMDLESPAVARAYRALIAETRDVAGNAMRRAWELPPAGVDTDMNIPDYNEALKELRAMERTYVHVAARRLRPLGARWRRELGTPRS